PAGGGRFPRLRPVARAGRGPGRQGRRRPPRAGAAREDQHRTATVDPAGSEPLPARSRAARRAARPGAAGGPRVGRARARRLRLAAGHRAPRLGDHRTVPRRRPVRRHGAPGELGRGLVPARAGDRRGGRRARHPPRDRRCDVLRVGEAERCASGRLVLPPRVVPGWRTLLPIRLDTPPRSARWYPGGCLFWVVHLVRTSPVAVAHWGTVITTPEVSTEAARVEIEVSVQNSGPTQARVDVTTQIVALPIGQDTPSASGVAVARTAPVTVDVGPGAEATAAASAVLEHPALWGPPP